jgi:hypothetical protein
MNSCLPRDGERPAMVAAVMVAAVMAVEPQVARPAFLTLPHNTSWKTD